jgi:hypothetical protein
MATFYLLPARARLGQRFAELLAGLFPGTSWPGEDWHDLGEALGSAAVGQGEAYVIYAEDLPEGDNLEAALMFYFGAEPGDEVVEVQVGRSLAEIAVQRWRMNEALAA